MTLLSAVAPVEETPIDRYLVVQADLTAVERFAQRHEAELVPRQARYYRDLIPLARPEPGQQYGFEVDLDACTGCKACVAACHSLNGLDDDESWRSVTVLRGGSPVQPLQQTVTAACHHCVDPACLKGCPVDAYEKDPVTGVVAHLDDQCIGCSYCTLTCPYEVPVYNAKRGIVRKCDMCQGRLAAGEAPACVQACPNAAIAVTVVDIAAARAAAGAGALAPGMPPSSITTPTTLYRTARPGWRETVAPDRIVARTAEPHTPLAVMLVLTQLSVGAFVTDLIMRFLAGRQPSERLQLVDAVMALAAGALALGASVLHLGRPRYCYRAVIGIRHSWLSREVVAFGAFTGLAASYAMALWLGWPIDGGAPLAALGVAVAACGLAGVACSVMVYATTHRRSWRAAVTAPRFVLTAAVCGLATVLCVSLLSPLASARPLLLTLAALMAVKLAAEATGLPMLLVGDLRAVAVRRFAAGLVGGVALPLVMVATRPNAAAAALALAGVVAGELAERRLFFTAATPPR